uniref:NADH-ubiquinone oxidoreductase chain 6 n=1 Tax=Pseudocollinella humida TaxID=1262325 RepID=A0A7D6WEM8_9MUSC|nr:NADH dehydrogenase subunit 6 [Pseudocollinella humida]
MMQFMLYSLLFIFSIIFTQMIHPLAMGLMLLIQTLLICLMTGLIAKSFWFSYILFLIFLGGMLVLFIYVTSLASNEMFTMSTKLMIMSFIFLMISMFIFYFMDKNLINMFFNNNEMESITNSVTYLMENSLSLNKLYNYPTNLITILLMNYLLITLIAVVKITKLFYGPLRLMN